MRRHGVVLAVCALLMAMAPVAAAAPSDGNGKKLVFDEVFEAGSVDCGGADLTLVIDFKAQFMLKEHGRNDEVATFNIELIYENDAGESWIFRDRGSDRLYEEDGVLYQAVAGRSGLGNIGLLIIEDPFGEPTVSFQKGRAIDPDAEACNRLG